MSMIILNMQERNCCIILLKTNLRAGARLLHSFIEDYFYARERNYYIILLKTVFNAQERVHFCSLGMNQAWETHMPTLFSWVGSTLMLIFLCKNLISCNCIVFYWWLPLILFNVSIIITINLFGFGLSQLCSTSTGCLVSSTLNFSFDFFSLSFKQLFCLIILPICYD
jgi:hypothetical protein